ncbi:MAG: hypothetical protein ONB44_17565 [candidate division KSB1 bacterium]|nr:hypothetical protein [candidate division KSB1 bacterium]MDZ7303935.1 hypothetical protein [candidate division KSB1 bacterium]MDZ7313096.1 hypothetical protein [candidate division KSB1 bacterium]
MLELIKSLATTPIPTILVVAGLFFLFLAIGGQFGAKIVTDRVKPQSAGIVGAVLLLAGVAIYWFGESTPRDGHIPPGNDLPKQIQRVEEELKQNERQQEEARAEIEHLRMQLDKNPHAQGALQEQERRLQELQRQRQALQEELERLRRLQK